MEFQQKSQHTNFSPSCFFSSNKSNAAAGQNSIRLISFYKLKTRLINSIHVAFMFTFSQWQWIKAIYSWWNVHSFIRRKLPSTIIRKRYTYNENSAFSVLSFQVSPFFFLSFFPSTFPLSAKFLFKSRGEFTTEIPGIVVVVFHSYCDNNAFCPSQTLCENYIHFKWTGIFPDTSRKRQLFAKAQNWRYVVTESISSYRRRFLGYKFYTIRLRVCVIHFCECVTAERTQNNNQIVNYFRQSCTI